MVLFQFGPTIVRVFGPTVFIITWIGAGVAGSAASLARRALEEKYGDGATNPGGDVACGASGSLFGLVALCACMAPYAEMGIMMVPVMIPAWQMLTGAAGFSAVASIFGWLPGLGHAAHLGGIAFGVLYYFGFLGRRIAMTGLRTLGR